LGCGSASTPGSRWSTKGALLLLEVPVEPDGTPPGATDPPYKGLVRFEAGDARLFHGREQLVAQLVARLVAAPFLAVLGASGSGKSSLARAATTSWDGSVIFWDLNPSSWEAKACALAGRNLTRFEWERFVGGAYRRTYPQWPEG
jgi:hypothetical protein